MSRDVGRRDGCVAAVGAWVWVVDCVPFGCFELVMRFGIPPASLRHVW